MPPPQADEDYELARPPTTVTHLDPQSFHLYDPKHPDSEVRPDVDLLLSLKLHWGLPRRHERLLFYAFAIPCWILLIIAAGFGAYWKTHSGVFIGTVTGFCVCHWAAWFQTAVAMVQRASWRREQELLEDRVQFLFFAVRLQRLMLPTALISLCTFIPAYVQRYHEDDIAYWLLFLLFFIIDTVGSVMNAYNNISWEADRLWFEDRIPGVPSTHFAIFGI